MSKVTIEFDPLEDFYEMQSAIMGSKYRTAIYELDQYYRGIYKYSEVGSEIEMAERVREKIREILSDNDLRAD
jgi:NAD+--asparagine ADP-ribosyltransferase